MKTKYRSTVYLACTITLLSVRLAQTPQSGCNQPSECGTNPLIQTNPSIDVSVTDPLFTTPDLPFWGQSIYITRNHWNGPAWYSIRNATAFSQYGIYFPNTEKVIYSTDVVGNYLQQLMSNPTLGMYRVTVDVRNQDKSAIGSATFTFAIVPDEGIYILRTPISIRQGNSDTTTVYLFRTTL